MEKSMLAGRDLERSASEERRTRFGLLLFAVIAVFAIQGIATPGRWEQLVVAVLLAITLLLSLRVAYARPIVMRVGYVLAAFVVLLALVEAIDNHANGVPVRIGNLLLLTVAPPATIIGIVRTLRMRNRVTIEAVLGVIAVYLLLGMFFAGLYGVIGQINGSFFAQDVSSTVARNLYFSFTTLTTVGYGDFTAASNLGHTLSVSEALLGQIYLVTVVSVIVGNLGRRRSNPHTQDAPDPDG
jgi:Ion channel